MSAFNHAKLALTVAELPQLPPATGHEVAFAGRSNAGKSSAINALTNRRRLAFVARRPGKTRTIQIYELAPERFLVDLPGYGYARVAETTRRQWGQLLDAYLGQRQCLEGLILIMDARHPLTPLDQQLLDWFLPRRIPVHVLLTKADKLSRSAAASALRHVQHALDGTDPVCTAQLFSSQARVGVAQAQEVIARWLSLPTSDATRARSAVPNKNPRLKGSKAGGKSALIGIKAPAQGGEAGDDETSSKK